MSSPERSSATQLEIDENQMRAFRFCIDSLSVYLKPYILPISIFDRNKLSADSCTEARGIGRELECDGETIKIAKESEIIHLKETTNAPDIDISSNRWIVATQSIPVIYPDGSIQYTDKEYVVEEEAGKYYPFFRHREYTKQKDQGLLTPSGSKDIEQTDNDPDSLDAIPMWLDKKDPTLNHMKQKLGIAVFNKERFDEAITLIGSAIKHLVSDKV